MNRIYIAIIFLAGLHGLVKAQDSSLQTHCLVEGYIKLNPGWRQTVYVSRMNHYQNLFSGFDGLITDSVQINSEGYFRLLLPSDAAAPVMYRLNVAPISSKARAGMFMWLPQENYLHLAAEAGKKMVIQADISRLTSSYELTESSAANRAIRQVHDLRGGFIEMAGNAALEMDKRTREHPDQADQIRAETMQRLMKEMPAVLESLKSWMDTTSYVHAWLLASRYYSSDNDKSVCYPQLIEKAGEWAIRYPQNTFVSDLLQEITEFIDYLPIGSYAPNIELSSPDGQMVRLYDVKARLILLDFWASWCSPCRVENKTYVAPLYEAFRDKGLEVFGVSFDTQSKRWTDAIQKDGYGWIHVSDLLGMAASPVSQTYRINSVPATFILDENKRIIAKDLRGDALRAFVKKILTD